VLAQGPYWTGSVSYYPKVIKAVFLTGRFIPGFSFLDPRFERFVFEYLILGSSFLGPRSLIFVPVAVGRVAADTCLYWLRGVRLSV